MVSPLREVEDEILIHNVSYYAGSAQMLKRLNVHNGRTVDVAHEPLRGSGTYFVGDEGGAPYFAVAEDPETLADRTFAWDPAKSAWKEIGKPGPVRSIIPCPCSR